MARANEQQKQQQKQKQLQQQQQQKQKQQQQQQKQQKQQKQISETRGSSLSPDLDPGAVSVDGFEARVPAICTHTHAVLRSLAIALAYALVCCGRRTHLWLSRRRARSM